MTGVYWRYAISRTIQASAMFVLLVLAFSAIANTKLEVTEKAQVLLAARQTVA